MVTNSLLFFLYVLLLLLLLLRERVRDDATLWKL